MNTNSYRQIVTNDIKKIIMEKLTIEFWVKEKVLLSRF